MNIGADILDMLALRSAMLERGYIPRRLWRLYRVIKGDKGVYTTGTKIRHNVWVLDTRRRENRKREEVSGE